LEYYDGIHVLNFQQARADQLPGILILTSNRVGTFDEAFKSRIQLNLRYKDLDKHQRLKIWEIFIKRLESIEDSRGSCSAAPCLGEQPHIPNRHGINAKEIRKKLSQLAETDLNGRQIRNTISTARQLSLYRGQPLGYEHLLHVISEAQKFENYLRSVHLGFSTEEIQADQGVR
jgi:hypothetical protein